MADDLLEKAASDPDRCPHPDDLAAHVRSFAAIMTCRQGQQELDGWLPAVEADDQPELRSSLNGIRRDKPAFTAGLTLPYSSAAVEGNVNRMIKRQMFGRAGFALLRERVIRHPG